MGSRGVCVWLTGPSGAGKSTLASELTTLLEERGRTVTVLDVVPELEKAPGERNSSGKLRRKAFVAARVADHDGVAICVTISSRREDRESAREIVGADRFVEVFLDTPSDVARERREGRDRRVPIRKRVRRLGLELARRVGVASGRGFEEPIDPDLVVDSVSESPAVGARRVLEILQQRGLLSSAARASE